MWEKIKLYLWLASVNMLISAINIGSGIIVVPMLRKHFVQKKNLFSEEELLGLVAIAHAAPGAVAINLATLTGSRAAGLPGAFICGISALLPPLIVLLLISRYYMELGNNQIIASALNGMLIAVCALIIDVVIDFGLLILRMKSAILTFIMLFSCVGCLYLNINVAVILAISVLIALTGALINASRAKGI